MFTPRRKIIVNHKFNFKSPQFKKNIDNISLKKFWTINSFASKTNSSFKQKELTLSSTYTIPNESNHKNKISQCLIINNRYYDNLNNDLIPSICTSQFKNSRNYFMNRTKNSSSFPKLTKETGKTRFNINLINTGELTQISSLLSSFKTPKKIKKRKISKTSKNNYKFNSLLYHLNKKTNIKDSQIENRYRPIIKEFFGKDDYLKFSTKSEKFLRPEELKMLYKDTRLIKTIFDYLNNTFSNIRYHQAIEDQKKLNEILEKKKQEKYYYNKVEENLNFPLEKFFKVKKVIYNNCKNIDKIISTEDNKLIKDISNKNDNNFYNKKNLVKSIILK